MPSTSVSRVSRGGAVTKTAAPLKSKPRTSSSQTTSKRTHRDLATEDYHLAHYSSTPPKKANNGKMTTTPQQQPSSGKKSSKFTSPKKTTVGEGEEKRQRRYRAKPPASFLVKLERAQTQRMIVLERRRQRNTSSEDGTTPAEEIDIVGSTGNIYTVTVSHVPTCTCPDSQKGNECKHKVYALHTVLKAPEHLVYQLALLSSELQEIFAHAPPIPSTIPSDDEREEGSKKSSNSNNNNDNRKPTDGECPICYMDLDEPHNDLVWCKAQCGHNLHKSCFDQWAKSSSSSSNRDGGVRCVYCRTPWEFEVPSDADAIRKSGERTDDGYVNVAAQFGISRARDYSGYHQPWARRRFGLGW